MQDGEKGKETKVSSLDLAGQQPPRQVEISEIHPTQNSDSVRVQIPEEGNCVSSFMGQDQQMGRAAVQMPVEQQLIPVENMKNGQKVAVLLITVSTASIVGFHSGGAKAHSSSTSEFLLKSAILAMFASLFPALGLLILSTKMLPTKMLPTKMPPTKNAKLSCSNLSLIILMGASFGLIVLAFVLFVAFVFI
ncbi:hypothetical protein SLEP1_g6874 [Rubroshorea leprosula]|uniref:PGG domain-containing protein n=1 Tax=Rubroshorea leprosula TaxID=152421 RepID=A0AAV5I5L7_9ROSI|nr:hypothetical protein SLEP1_g6874 [Rubroshorea leprosula]